MSNDVPTLIARMEDERYAAMLSGDHATLERLLDERLRYVHSNGTADSKSSYISGFKSGLWDYRSISRDDQIIIPLGDTALVFNRLRIDIVVSGTPKLIYAHALAVWNRSDGTWQLTAVLSASIPVG